ncbi:hypothetical protein Pmani_038495 [Petrolisthes manimaculis]|uniref:Uncharacterized protein n=1 Tax=Petrolisthes manimaculis TaxID=1843537 RepID=A0AAE1NF36_9EUCA|nr:hypothetical protein Pmani_038495 [Petrolisthes manimaculis]
MERLEGFGELGEVLSEERRMKGDELKLEEVLTGEEEKKKCGELGRRGEGVMRCGKEWHRYEGKGKKEMRERGKDG